MANKSVKQNQSICKVTHVARGEHEETCPWEFVETLERVVDFHRSQTGGQRAYNLEIL